MLVYHFHPDTAIYVGSSEADESPLEPGVWLIPAAATTDAPPPFGVDEQAVYLDGAWRVQPIPEPEPEPEPEPVLLIEPAGPLTLEQKLALFGLSLDELKAALTGGTP